MLSRFLTDKGIPEEFLKSNYFTLRPQLVQLYQEDPTFGQDSKKRWIESRRRWHVTTRSWSTRLIEPICPNIHSKKWREHLAYNHLSEGSRLQRTTGHHQAALSDHSRCHNRNSQVAAAERNVHSNTRVQVHQRPTFYARSARQNDQRPGFCSISLEKWQPFLSKS